ncbi:VWA domain-containing protein [Haloechinothrix sp. LS1_15]|uniref:vWA domain-containing protein n=1 Tax=Haloechinothrix sp. LS1_15 TaxID=2652248 RepID=UPI0029462BDB|nr:VWA domain-containing protein [Haloechinothrix sp. LS1_15]MDV6011275.1 VWA domain-containing protein [Haloechinothrix sp. LS1_15]
MARSNASHIPTIRAGRGGDRDGHRAQPDVLPGLVGFTRALARAGLPVGTDAAAAYLAAVRAVDAVDVEQVYWAGRATLCSNPDEFDTYDAVFARWFGPDTARSVRASRQEPRHAELVPLGGTGTGKPEEPEIEPGAHAVAASDTEVLRRRDIGELTEAEREHLRRMLALLRPAPPMRRSLRLRPARRGSLDPRRTVRAMLSTGGEPLRLARRGHAVRPRRVVLLIDISGSMRPYADALLRFAHATARRTPGAVEAFTLGTRLTRVSRQLRQRDPERALAAANRSVEDFAGGTRLGDTLRTFLDRWGQRGVARQSVAVVFSDGWERGDAATLGEQVARLRRLAHAVLWVNPHAGKDGYAPVQGGMAAALPHVDRLLAGHSLATLDRLVEEIRDARRT